MLEFKTMTLMHYNISTRHFGKEGIFIMGKTIYNRKVTNANIKPLKRKNSFLHNFIENMELSLLLIPGIIFFIVFAYIPMFGVVIAFKDYKNNLGIFGSKWVGFDNFKFFFTSQDAWRITRNTIGYGALFIVVGIISAVIVALLLYEVKKKLALKVFQTSMILPNFLSWVIVGYITYILLEPNLGLINQFLKLLGKEGIGWYSETKYWPFILTATNIWKGVGMSCIMYYAALIGIDPSLYEAATVDGATKFQQAKHISLPALVPLMTIMMILQVGHIIKTDKY
jgi:putative aldouronate transport system permease protein